MVNKVRDKVSLSPKPELTSKADDKSTINFTLNAVLILHSFIILTYFFGIPKKIIVFHDASLFILSDAFL